MQKMGGGMILPNGIATRVVNLQQQWIANLDRALPHRDHVSKDVARFFLCIVDGCAHALAADFSSVPDLPTAFAVEWSLVDHHSTGFAFFQLGNLFAVLHESCDYPLCALGFISKKFRYTDFFAQCKPDRLLGGLARAGPGCSSLFTLPVHRVGERCNINRNTARAERVLSQVKRESVSVVERERSLAVEHRPFFKILAFLIENCEPAFEGATKSRFLELERLGD